jgi:hypothetical protein
VKNVSDDPRLSDREKYVDNPHRVVEYMGAKRLSLRIHLLGAEPYLNASRCAGAGVETVVGARVGFPGWPFDFANLIHFVRRTDDGCEMRSRFWLGRVRWHTRRARVHGESYPWNRLLGHLSVRESDARAMLVHCAMEMQHLASFLPDLFEALGRR